MLHKRLSLIALLVLSALTLSLVSGGATAQQIDPQRDASVQASVGTAFTYQGRLTDGGSPADGDYDFEFELHEDPSVDSQVGSTITVNDKTVTDGLFTVGLDFGNVFTGSARYLEIGVRPGDSGGAYTSLGRQELTAAPYALGLRPGATISGTIANGHVLEVVNRYDSGTIGSAIVGRASADTSPAIAAYHEGTGHALYGSTSSGYPTIGGVNDGSGRGVDGRSEQGVGVRGFTNNSDGASGSYGVVGVQTGYSASDSPDSYWKGGGFFGGDNGVVGLTNESGGFGVFGYNAATASGSGYAGRFISENGNGVRISSPDGTVGLRVSGGSLVVDSGVKNAAVPTDQGDRLLYAEEATEVVFADYGFGQLSNGTASIAIDPLFAQTVSLDHPYHVFVQVYGDAEVYVDNRTAAGFDVILREGDDSVEFSYRIVAKRLGYEEDRLEPAPWETLDETSDGASSQGMPQ